MQSEGATIKAWLTSFWGARLKFPRAAANWISLDTHAHTHTHTHTHTGRSPETATYKHHLWDDTDTHIQSQRLMYTCANADKENRIQTQLVSLHPNTNTITKRVSGDNNISTQITPQQGIYIQTQTYKSFVIQSSFDCHSTDVADIGLPEWSSQGSSYELNNKDCDLIKCVL